MVSFLLRMPAGVAGAITRPLESTTEPGILYRPTDATPALSPSEYGCAVVLDSSTKRYRLPTVGDVDRDVRLLVRPYPGGLEEFQGVLGVTPVDTIHVADVMKRGYLSVKLRSGAAVKHGRVYVRKANAVTGKPIGGFEAAPDFGTTAGVVTGTGNGTWTPDPTAPVATSGLEGGYRIVFTSGTAYNVYDPNGNLVGNGVITATTGQTSVFNGQIKGTITEGSVVFVTGDVITVTVAFNTITLNNNTEFTGPAYTDPNFGAITEVAFNL